MNQLNPGQIQSVVTQVNIIISELYMLRQRVAQLEAENKSLVEKLSITEAQERQVDPHTAKEFAERLSKYKQPTGKDKQPSSPG